jgi:phage FluMu protein Com
MQNLNIKYPRFRPVQFEYHYDIYCPYCRTVDIFVIKPLEATGIAKFKKCLIEYDVVARSENLFFNEGKKTSVPLIILREELSNARVKYFALERTTSTLRAASSLAKSLLEEISRIRNVSYDSLKDLNPLLKKLIEFGS